MASDNLPATMKALVKSKPGVSYEFKDVPVPSPGKDELLVRVRKIALCGTDIAKYKWNDGNREADHEAKLFCSNYHNYCACYQSIFFLYS